MNSFTPTEQRLAVTCRRQPGFPREPAVLVRLIKHIYRRLNDDANAVLKPWGISHPEYNILMMLYGTEDFTMNPTQLSDAAGEKSANITRLTNQLFEKGLIERSAGAGDRRKIALSLSKAGLKTIESFVPAISDVLHRQTDGLKSTDIEQLERLLKKFLLQLEPE